LGVKLEHNVIQKFWSAKIFSVHPKLGARSPPLPAMVKFIERQVLRLILYMRSRFHVVIVPQISRH